MWLRELLAADATVVSGGSLTVVIGGVVIAAIGALGLVAQEWIRSRRSDGESPPKGLGERVAVLEDWRVQTMKVDDIHDRQVARALGDVEDLVRWMNREHPGWRP